MLEVPRLVQERQRRAEADRVGEVDDVGAARPQEGVGLAGVWGTHQRSAGLPPAPVGGVDPQPERSGLGLPARPAGCLGTEWCECLLAERPWHDVLPGLRQRLEVRGVLEVESSKKRSSRDCSARWAISPCSTDSTPPPWAGLIWALMATVRSVSVIPSRASLRAESNDLTNRACRPGW